MAEQALARRFHDRLQQQPFEDAEPPVPLQRVSRSIPVERHLAIGDDRHIDQRLRRRCRRRHEDGVGKEVLEHALEHCIGNRRDGMRNVRRMKSEVERWVHIHSDAAAAQQSWQTMVKR
jgi:dienelactone hydrolase